MSKTNFYNEIRNNNIKTFFLFLLFFLVIILIAYVVKIALGATGFGILFYVGFFVVIFSIIGYYTGDKIVLASSGAKKVKRENYPYLYNVVEGLSYASGIPVPKIHVINSNSPNAFATGRNPKNASIAVTSGLLKLLNRSELEGVVAHEISHIKNRDIKVMMVASVFFGIILMFSDISLRYGIFASMFGGGRDNKGNPIGIILLIVVAVLAPIFATLIKYSISRKREYLADASAAKITRYPKGLADALTKIRDNPHVLKNVSRGTAHLFISNPLSKGSVKRLFSTHPPINDRIAKLNNM